MNYAKKDMVASGYLLPSVLDEEVATDRPSSDAGSLSDLDDIGSIDGRPRGQFNRIAVSILMPILYAARMARFDFLATHVSR